jgi:hypothetical protein
MTENSSLDRNSLIIILVKKIAAKTEFQVNWTKALRISSSENTLFIFTNLLRKALDKS